ncbi:MAG: hypothetical protein NTY05_09070 [Rhodocyclales bacterium]|nr:hypothetical protein [Rhodocyclales bacterium]
MSIHWRAVPILAAAIVATGCQSIGAGSVQRDRISYADALGTSWKEQTLLNIVKLRYLDTPVFLDVSSVITSYELAREVNLTANIFPGAADSNNQSLGAKGTYTDKPTISYAPITGERYMNALVRPIPPQAIFAMIESGHRADLILQVTARAINGVYNYSASQTRTRTADPTFQKVIEAIRGIQQGGALSVRIEKRDEKESTYIGFLHGADEDVEKSIRFVKDKLGINPTNDEPQLVFGSRQRNPDQIALLTRSVQEILTECSVGVEVPERDLAEGRATPMLHLDPSPGSRGYPLMHIRSSSERPADVFAAVPYRNRWFWIDDRDLDSKRMFMFLTVFSALAETGIAPQTPLITIPAR